MTQKIAVDQNNDWYLGEDKHLAISTGLQAVLEECEHVMKVVIGELVFNISRGVLSFEVGGVFGNAPDLLFFDSRSRRALLGVADVLEIVSFDAARDGDKIVYRAVIRTIYGTETLTDTISE